MSTPWCGEIITAWVVLQVSSCWPSRTDASPDDGNLQEKEVTERLGPDPDARAVPVIDERYAIHRARLTQTSSRWPPPTTSRQ
jgi:hypothetical protein